MMKQIVPDEVVREISGLWEVSSGVSFACHMARHSAAWALEQAAQICDHHGRLDGHSCAEEIRAIGAGGDDGQG